MCMYVRMHICDKRSTVVNLLWWEMGWAWWNLGCMWQVHGWHWGPVHFNPPWMLLHVCHPVQLMWRCTIMVTMVTWRRLLARWRLVSAITLSCNNTPIICHTSFHYTSQTNNIMRRAKSPFIRCSTVCYVSWPIFAVCHTSQHSSISTCTQLASQNSNQSA